MSARSCSLACRVFFKRDPLMLEEAPDRPVARWGAALGQLGHHRAHRQIRLLGDPRQQPRAFAGQPQLPPPTHLLGGRAAARAPTLRPLHDTGHAHPEQRRRRPTGATAYHRADHAIPQVLRIGSCHLMLAPAPASILNHKTLNRGIPFLIQPLELCSRLPRSSGAPPPSPLLGSPPRSTSIGRIGQRGFVQSGFNDVPTAPRDLVEPSCILLSTSPAAISTTPRLFIAQLRDKQSLPFTSMPR